ncbi:basement membrane-specific heparan sulfate proteoglycan core protein isoform X5 [Clarias gariepinus]|uniref:basement membrane-specific heparan sulfate proteoglycan core protein isoform X5 n=1 Tax=Clarias gariepinus TaxID=13013 RepID=UPI00234D20E6|nr:basement membrane-specific heparan sulfate proteoglycan core protein isoform X5 [Clarias gariepinus]
MGTRTGARGLSLLILMVIGSHLINVAQSSKVWDEVPVPEDLEAASVPRLQRYLEDDEDFAADQGSGDLISGDEEGSTSEIFSADPSTTIYYRALVNFTDSFTYGPELDDIDSAAFQEISAAIVDTLESDYSKIAGTQTVNVVLIKQIGKDVFVELDVGSEDNANESQLRQVLYSVVEEGSISSYTISPNGFQFRRLGEPDTGLHVEPLASPVKPSPVEPCSSDEFSCRSGACIPQHYVCDNRPDCPDMSDEINCEKPVTLPPIQIPFTTSEIKTPARPGPCRSDQSTCQNGQCISRDYLCDGESDCSDGSDEFKCGTPSPCEPNEFKCQNGRCALKLWRCDGDNDCHDNSDEINCPAKRPGDVCAPEQFTCLSDQTCIPASYQCDEEADCPDRSDEYGCVAPTVTSPPEESVSATRGQTVTFRCIASGVPVPIITWRLNWGHIPASNRITMTSENGHGMLTIRDVKEGDQGAYTCEAINAKGLVFAIPDGVLTLTRESNNCPGGHFNIGNRCVPCFCAGISKNCHGTRRYRSQIALRFTEEEDFKGVNVSFPSRPSSPPPLSSTQMMVNPEVEEFQLVDLSRRFLDLESYWTLPRQFLGSKVDSYGGYLKYKVRYLLQRDGSEPVDKPDVVLRGNGHRLVYRRGPTTFPDVKNQREIKFTEENWQHSSGQPVSREDLLMTLANLESISIRTVYNNRMASVGLSDITMDTTSTVFSFQGQPNDVEECRCPPGYSGLSCESCSSGFERVPGGRYLGTCAGCNCHGHASACDPISGHCLSCQHNTEGPQCDKCRPGYFGDPSRGRPDDCKPCPCPYTETSRRFSDTCFLDVDGQATCDACEPGYTGRRCERCAPRYEGNPLQPNGRCIPQNEELIRCDNRGTISSSSRPCNCKANVAGALCDQCKPGSFHLFGGNPDGCLQCFCMGVTKECASSTWTRDQVRGGVNGQLFSLANEGNTRSVTEGITQRGGAEVVYRSFSSIPKDIYYWVLPQSFQGDKVTAYGGELRYKVRYEPGPRSLVIENKPDVVLQGNGIFLEHYSLTKTLPRVPTTFAVTFRPSAWRRSDGQPCTREHLLMALADISVFMIRATYADEMAESSLADIQMDIAVPHSTGNEQALEVEECACPQGYRGPSCQDCDEGYTRTGSGLYLGTCEKCECHGHASGCDSETGACLQCQHNTAGARCENCRVGFYGDPVTGGIHACRQCPCFGPASASSEMKACYLDTDGHPTCSSCPPGYTGRRCERCAPGYTGNPEHGQSCTKGNGNCQNCDQRGSEGCDSNGICRCKMNVEGPSCSSCKPGAFNLSPANKDGCLACFCMGVTQQCSSSSLYRDVVSTVFAPGNVQGFTLVNRQRTNRITTGFSVELSTEGTQLSFTNFDHHSLEPHFWQLPSSYQGDKYSLVYKGSSMHSEDVLFWKLPEKYHGDKVNAYGGKLKYTISYVIGPRGTPIEDVDVQIIGNDITLVARQDWKMGPGTRQTRTFEFIFREEYWQRPDGMPATREHLLMVLADLDDILIRASYHTVERSSSISGVSMEIAVPQYTGLERAVDVEQCRCPPGYHGLSCQDCAQGYTRTGGGLYLGHCEPCECNGHSDSCHPETGTCTYCQHNTMGELCEQCSAGFFGDASAGTPEDCQPCACPHTDSEHQFSPTCESLGNGDYRCTACQPGYTGQYCERCAPGYFGNPQQRVKCRPQNAGASLVVKVYPERVQVSPGSSVTLRCQASGPPPHYFYWTRNNGLPISSSAERRRQGEELHFASVQPSDAGVYTCTCRNQLNTNRSQAEIIVGVVRPIEVFIEEPKSQRVFPGNTVNFICTAKSILPAYTLVWTRQGSGKLPERAMDFNGILTIRNVRPEDAGIYVCTGSNMFAMDEGTAILYVPEGSKAEMFYTAYEMFEGHRQPGEVTKPTVTINPAVLNVQQGQRVEVRCTATGSPAPTIEWTGGPGNRISSRAIIRGGVLTFPSVQRSDQGEYTCRAFNIHGEHAARTVLSVSGSSVDEGVKPTVTIQPSLLRVQQGTRAEFHCTATGNPAPSIEWTRSPGKSIRGSTIIRNGVLTFPSVERSDEGDYICKALNTHGEQAARAVLVVQGSSAVEVLKPTVTIDSPVVTVQQGQRAELRCTATGNPTPSFEWTGGPGNRISSSAVIRGGVLIFPSVQRSDEGEYTCRAFNIHGEHAARLVLYVQSSSAAIVTRPTVTIHPPVVTIQQGQRAEFRCTATGNPAPTVEWTGGPGGNRISSRAIIQGGVLTFPSVQRSEEGDYTCRAVNAHGEHTARAVLYVHSASLPHVQVSPQRVEIHEGETLRLYCRAGGSPSPGLTWKKRGGALPPQAIPSHGFHQFKSNSLDALQKRIDEMQARTERTDYGTLLIPEVKMSDAGTYLCIGTNAIGSSEAVIYVTVIKSETVPSDVTIQSTSSTVVQGETLELNCIVQGNPPPSVIWSRANGLGLSSNHQVVGSKLRILQASPDDSGEYICRVYGGPGTRQATIYVSVTSEAVRHQSPIISIEPHSIVVRKGEPASFWCRLHTGAQPIRLEWKLSSNEPLADNVKLSPDGSELTISSAQPVNQGAYRCVASNPYGVTHSIASLIVREPPTATVTPTGPLKVQVGEPINLECQAAGEPRPSVTWHRLDNNRRTIMSSPLSMESRAVMQILVARPEDSGTYICTAQNSQGRSETRVEVIIEGGTQVPSAPRAIVRDPLLVVEDGKTAVLHCDAHGFPKPTITWSKLRSPLPWRHKIVNNSLILPSVGPQDSGQYICNATNDLGVSEVTIMVDVETPPRTTTLHDDVAVRVGEVIRLQCLAHGTPPMRFEWSKVGGRLPPRAEVQGANLQINLADPSDAGTYKCIASNKVGRSEAVAKVSVRSPLSVRVSPQVEVKALGSAVEFTCSASGGPEVTLEWLKEGGTLPHNHHIKDGVLRIENLEKSNEGMYICRATTLFGQAQDTAKLTIQEPPSATVTPTGPLKVQVGEPINLECQAAGEPRPSVTWHRLDNNRRPIMISPLPMESNAVMQILVARPEDSGTYICTAQNSQGRSETRVEVIIEGGTQAPSAPRAIVRDPLLVVEEGKTAVLHCDAHGFPKPTITWSKLRSPLPWRHKIVNNSLILPSVGPQDSGQYICNATNDLGVSEVTIMVDVETPPHTTTLPDDVAVRVGEVIRLQCLAHGTPPMRFEWSKVGGRLPPRAEVQGANLQINLADPSDAGTYKCIASNKVGRSEAVAKVSVRSPLSVRVSPQVEVKALGSAVEFTCSASGGPEVTLEWLKEGGTLPHNHHIKDGVLRIENLEKSNEGMYICRATTLFGQAQDTAKLTIQALPKVMINVRTSVQTVTVGTSVEFECHAEGDPVPSVHWSKGGAPLPDHVQVKGAVLRIDRVNESDAGQYRCTATNNVGSVQSQVVLNIQSLPQIVAQPDAKEVTVGSSAIFPCIATGYPVPNITWSKRENELPPKCLQDGHVLIVPGVTHEDSGTYVCTASNKQGKVEAFTKLIVHERVMPYFSQEPLSYLMLPTIKNSYKAFKIQITFRPDNVDGLILYSGMILYNGQKKKIGADFISLGLVGGRPEFRFDVGSGMATIRYPTAIKLGEFHTVQLYRNGTQGSIIVDDKAPIYGTSQGKFQGLDLNEELFVGGYPNYSMIAKTAELKSGFVGCISQLIIQGDEVIFKDLKKNSTGVTNCPTCKDDPCQHGGSCKESVESLYKCTCPKGYTGSNCQHRLSEHCHPEACGPDATCINRPNGFGYDCRCHLGKYGHKCMDGTLVTTPLFNTDDSYIAYPPLTNIHDDLRIDIEFKPMDEDGLIFFIGGQKMKVEDFVTLSLVDGHVEFRYELGTGQALLRSQEQVSVGQWHHVTAERSKQDGILRLDDGPEVKRSSPGKAKGLNVHTSMFLGGVPNKDILPKPANVSMFYDGCIGEVSINGKKIDLSYTFTESRAIRQCIDASPCDRRPCQYGGTCMPSAEYEFQCLCRDGYDGERCELVRDTCLDSSQCHNGGSCVSGHCVCAAGYAGLFCREDSPVQYAAFFHDDGYLGLPKQMFPRSAPEAPETIELEINTLSSDGLILWQGVESGDKGKGKDFISVGLQNGHVVFSYQLGSGEAEILSKERINDGRWHKLTAVRTGKQGYIQVDDRTPQHGQSPGRSVMVNTKGSIYLGGAPDMAALTGGKFSSGITGCVRNLSLLNARPGEQASQPIDLQHHTGDGKNVQRCSS